jgi:predicted ester cyclase
MGIAPTGKHISWTENEIFRFEGGRIVESWGEGGLDEALAEIGLGFRSGQGRS